MQRIIRRIAPDRQMPELITGLREILAGLFRAPMQTVLRGAGANLYCPGSDTPVFPVSTYHIRQLPSCIRWMQGDRMLYFCTGSCSTISGFVQCTPSFERISLTQDCTISSAST